MINWKKNLVFIWLSQFLSIMGFAFAMPFVPYYMQTLGVTDPQRLKLWIALFTAAAPLSLAVFSPIWGWVADRYGRRLMLLRANLGAAVFLCLMGVVDTVWALVLLRTLQGVLTGTMTAAQTMVASHTPNHRSGLALGTLSSGVYCGAMAGAAFGGIFADAFGYRNAFFAASGLLTLAAILVVFGTNEKFVRAAPDKDRSAMCASSVWARLSPVWPMLGLMGVLSLLRRFDTPFLPLLVQEIHGSVEGAATRMGSLFAVAAVAGLVSGVLFGHLSDRIPALSLVRIGALCGGLLLIPQSLVHTFPSLFILRFLTAFCVGGLHPVLQSWLAKSTRFDNRGLIFGWAATVRALGWGIAPLGSGLVAAAFGTRSIFLVGGVLFLIMVWVVPRLVRPGAPDTEIDNSGVK